MADSIRRERGPPSASSFMKHTASQGRAMLDTRGTIMNVQSLDLEQLCPNKERDRAWAQRKKRTQSGSRGLLLGGNPATLARAPKGAALLSEEGEVRADPREPWSRAGRPASIGLQSPKASGLSLQGASHTRCRAQALHRHQAEMPHGVEGGVTDNPESCQETARPRAALLSIVRRGNSPSKPSRERALRNGDHVGRVSS